MVSPTTTHQSFDERRNFIGTILALTKRFDPSEEMPLEVWNDYVDKIELQMAQGDLQSYDVKHRFADGMYIREIYMPKGAMIVSNIHKTTHPFTILEGVVRVRTHKGTETLTAPYMGITTPGTRRILYIEEDTRWATFHATELKDVQQIMDTILEKRTNPLLTESQLLKIQQRVKQSNLLN